MVNIEQIAYVRNLYEKLFHEDANNSKEFLTFAHGNPHPLRIKIEEYMEEIENEIFMTGDKEVLKKLPIAQELDSFIMTYIDDNGRE